MKIDHSKQIPSSALANFLGSTSTDSAFKAFWDNLKKGMHEQYAGFPVKISEIQNRGKNVEVIDVPSTPEKKTQFIDEMKKDFWAIKKEITETENPSPNRKKNNDTDLTYTDLVLFTGEKAKGSLLELFWNVLKEHFFDKSSKLIPSTEPLLFNNIKLSMELVDARSHCGVPVAVIPEGLKAKQEFLEAVKDLVKSKDSPSVFKDKIVKTLAPKGKAHKISHQLARRPGNSIVIS